MMTSYRSATLCTKLETCTGCSSRLPSVEMTVRGMLLVRACVQVLVGPVLRKRKRYLRRLTRMNGWMAPLMHHLSPNGTLPSGFMNSVPSEQNDLSLNSNGISWTPYPLGNRSAAGLVSFSLPLSRLSNSQYMPARPLYVLGAV